MVKRPLSVEAAVRRDLEAFGGSESGLAASALILARELDRAGNSATSKAMCARALAETLDRLRALAPPAVADAPVDGFRERTQARLRVAK